GARRPPLRLRGPQPLGRLGLRHRDALGRPPQLGAARDPERTRFRPQHRDAGGRGEDRAPPSRHLLSQARHLRLSPHPAPDRPPADRPAGRRQLAGPAWTPRRRTARLKKRPAERTAGLRSACSETDYFEPVTASSARRVSTAARWRRYSGLPFRSSGGCVPSAAWAEASRRASGATAFPVRARSAAAARRGRGPIPVSPIATRSTRPSRRLTWAATATMAQS